MNRILTTALLTGFSSFAFAAQNLNYTVPLGTVSNYKSISVNKTIFNELTITNEDGSPVQKSIQDAMMIGFKNIDLTTTADITETVREVLADGTRVVDAANTASVETKSGIIESLEQDLKTSLSNTQPSIYGQGYELNQPLFFEYKIQNSGFGQIEAQVNGSRTLTKIGAEGQLEFQIQTTTSAYTAKLEFQELTMVSEYQFPASTINSTQTYLSDGRLEHSNLKSIGAYKFKTSFKLLDQKIIISGTANLNLETSSDLVY